MTYERYTNGHAKQSAKRDIDEVQSDVRSIRTEMDETIDALSHRLEPKQLMHQAVDRLGEGEFINNLGESVSQNPVPLLLIGAGVGYMMYSDRQRRLAPPTDRSASDRATGRWGEPGGPTYPFGNTLPEAEQSDADSASNSDGSGILSKAGEALSDAANTVKDSAKGASRKMHGGLSRASNGVQDGLSSASRKVRGGYRSSAEGLRDGYDTAATGVRAGYEQAADSANALGRRTAEGARDMTRRSQDFLQERPLVIAGLGLALGAAFAGTAPMTRRERELLGEPMGDAMDRAESLAREKASQAKQMASAAGSAVHNELREQLPSSSSAGDALRDLTDRGIALAKDAGASAKRAAADEAEGQRSSDAESSDTREATASGTQDDVTATVPRELRVDGERSTVPSPRESSSTSSPVEPTRGDTLSGFATAVALTPTGARDEGSN